MQAASVPQMLRSKSEARILRVEAGAGEAAAMSRSQSMPSSTLLEASRRRLAAAEAAAVAAAAAQQLREDGAAAKEFVNMYMKAIADGNARWGRCWVGTPAWRLREGVRHANRAAWDSPTGSWAVAFPCTLQTDFLPPHAHPCSWASAPEVGSLFTEDARMVSADRQAFHGRQAIVRRLNQGVEQLARMAGDQPELPTFELSGPEPAVGNSDAAVGPGEQSLVLRLTLKRGLHRMTFTMAFTMKGGRIAALLNTRS